MHSEKSSFVKILRSVPVFRQTTTLLLFFSNGHNIPVDVFICHQVSSKLETVPFLLIPRRRKNKRNELIPPLPSPSLSFSLITRPHYYYEFKHHNHFHNNTSHNFTKRKSIFSRLELISEFYVISSHKVQIPAPSPSQSPRPLPTLILLLLHDSRLLLRR